MATSKYNDIIYLNRPISQKYPHMSAAGRAAQFAPYKTITIYHDQIDEVENNRAAFCEHEIIPDEDYFEYTEDFGGEVVLDDLNDINTAENLDGMAEFDDPDHYSQTLDDDVENLDNSNTQAL